MKTAISVPDEVFRLVDERAASLGISRSEFYATAARKWLDELDGQSVTTQFNDVLARIGPVPLDVDGVALIARMTADDEWD